MARSGDEPNQTGTRRPVDASMGLLKVLTETALEPEYRSHQDHPDKPRSRALLVCLIAGVLFGVAALQTTKQAPAAEQERAQLISQAKAAQTTNDQLTAQLNQLRLDVSRLSQAKAPIPSASQAALDQLQIASGATAVTGPGVVITLDDADALAGTQDPHSVVIDQDLRQLVNGLWASGAEAISINGHRISSRTAIRGAGAAITVDYVSLTRPYKVEAIGNPATLPADFSRTEGGRWWAYLKQNYAMKYEITTADELTLPADPTLKLNWAESPK